jgi:8-oxo-dGTP pyrophosphatase MutT (NUDIX family)
MKKCVGAVIFNETGQILAVSRKTNHDDFGLPGGKVDPEDGDDMIMALRREIREETGLEIFDIELVDCSPYRDYMQYTYICKCSGEIHTNEPHVVKWTVYSTIIDGCFGDYNLYLANILKEKGIPFAMN